MAFAPDERYTSARALQDALENALDRFNRRIGRREIGDLVCRLFAETREKVRAIIDAGVKRVVRESSSTLPMAIIESNPGLTLDQLRPTMVEPGVQRRQIAAVPIAVPPAPTEPGPGSASGTAGTLAATNINAATSPGPHASKSRAVFVVLGA